MAGGRVPSGASSAPRISSKGSDQGIACQMSPVMSPVIAIGVGVYGAENCRGYRAQCGSKGDADDVASKLAVDNIPAWSNIMVGRIPFVLAVWRVGLLGVGRALSFVSIRRNIELTSPMVLHTCSMHAPLRPPDWYRYRQCCSHSRDPNVIGVPIGRNLHFVPWREKRGLKRWLS